MKITLVIKDNSIKFYMNGFIHLLLKKDQLIAIQSWVLGTDHKMYYIEFVMKDKSVVSCYDGIDKWKNILKLIDENNLCGTDSSSII